MSIITEKEFQNVFDETLDIGRKYDFEERHSIQVTKLSLTLFSLLKELHGLNNDDKKILIAASMLHDVGCSIDYKKHHKHSRNIILTTKFITLSPPEIILTANVARYHRKAEPNLSHKLFAKLSAEEKKRVKILSSIIRIADALDRFHQDKVKNIDIFIQKGVLQLRLVPALDYSIEQIALDKKGGLFYSIFGLKPIIKV